MAIVVAANLVVVGLCVSNSAMALITFFFRRLMVGGWWFVVVLLENWIGACSDTKFDVGQNQNLDEHFKNINNKNCLVGT